LNRKETDSIKTTRDALSVKLDYLSIVFDKAKAVSIIYSMMKNRTPYRMPEIEESKDQVISREKRGRMKENRAFYHFL